MALGGGTFTTQNKVLPGAYINVVSAARASATLGERGVVALPIALTWGEPGKVSTVTAEEFIKDSMKIFGFAYGAAELQPLREVFKHAQKVHIYNLDADSAKASVTMTSGQSPIFVAKKSGARGNALKAVVQTNIDNETQVDVSVYLDGSVVFKQDGVAISADIKDNDYFTVASGGVTAADLKSNIGAGKSFSGGTDGTVDAAAYQNALNALESYNYNVLICPDTDNVDLYVEFTKRMRDNVGVKFQTVIPKVADSDYEGIVQLTEAQAPALYWVAGALAGCAINKSCTNMKYDGELDITCSETQTELEQRIVDGIFVFHKVEDETHVLVDINSFVSVTVDKNELFCNNQTIRVIDERSNTAAATFNKKYLGKVQNDASGRISFWGDLVAHAREMEKIRAIENYNTDELIVNLGNSKGAVEVTDALTIVGTMEKLYMTSVIS